MTLSRKFLAITAVLLIARSFFYLGGISFQFPDFLSLWIPEIIVWSIHCMAYAGITILLTDLVFGSRFFWHRLAENLVWVGGVCTCCLMIHFTLLTHQDPDNDIVKMYPALAPSFSAELLFFYLKSLPLLWIASQLPLWAVAYGTSWQLNKTDAVSNRRRIWGLQDWLLGSLIFSVSLGISKLVNVRWEDGILAGFFACLVTLPSILIILRPRSFRWAILAGACFLLLLFIVEIYFTTSFRSINKTEGYIYYMIASLFDRSGPALGAMMLRLEGYRLERVQTMVSTTVTPSPEIPA